MASEGHSSINTPADVVPNRRTAGGIKFAALLQPFLRKFERIAALPALDLLIRAIRLRIAFIMAAPAIGDAFQ